MVGPKILVIVVHRELILELHAEEAARLVRPAARDVSDGVPAAAEDEDRHVESLHVLQALGVAFDGEVEAAESVAAERVRAGLKHHRVRLVHLHHLAHDGLEELLVGEIVNPVFERHVHGVVLARAVAQVLEVTCPRKVPFAEFVERDGHHPVRGVERLLDAVTVVDIDVDVQDAMMVLQKLEDSEHNVVHVAKPRRFVLFAVVQTASPVDHYLALFLVQLHCAADRTSRVNLAKVEQAIEHRTVLPDVEALELPDVLVLVVRSDEAQKLDVLVGVKARHVLSRARPRLENLELFVDAVRKQQLVRHAHAVRLHRMPLAVVVVAHIRVVEVRHLLLAACWSGHGPTDEKEV
mmetsp:Transcript_6128/g.20644  ORF Transcript_6128/g.20644 Transcript_6128/m.20644 type:complete len:351 (+) Transcript_6128:838-1890(+)